MKIYIEFYHNSNVDNQLCTLQYDSIVSCVCVCFALHKLSANCKQNVCIHNTSVNDRDRQVQVFLSLLFIYSNFSALSHKYTCIAVDSMPLNESAKTSGNNAKTWQTQKKKNNIIDYRENTKKSVNE